MFVSDGLVEPLAETLRPKSLDQVFGQSDLLGKGQPFRRALESGKLPSMILWGPPGTGKTTLARLAAQAAASDFIALSAVISRIIDIRAAVERARFSQPSRKPSSRSGCQFLAGISPSPEGRRSRSRKGCGS